MSEWRGGEEEDEVEVDESQYGGNPAIIFLVDCRRPMLEQSPSLLQQCLGTIAGFCRDSVVTDNKQKIGVCLFGAEKAQNPNDFPNVHVLFDCEVPDTKQNMQLLNLADGEGFDQFGHTEVKLAFHHALWVCSTMFSNCTGKLVNKEIFVLTSDPDPTAGDPTLRGNALRKAQDLESLGIHVQVYPVTVTGQFDTKLFYAPLLENVGMLNQTTDIRDLTKDVKIKASKQRAACTALLRLGPELALGVELYVCARRTTTSATRFVEKKTNREVKCETKYISGTSARVIEKSELSSVLPFADGFAYFNEDELRQLKSCGEPGIVVLGFRSADSLPIEHQIKPSHFIYPTDKFMTGSTTTFAALHKQMLVRGVLAIASVRLTTKASQRLAALVPQRAEPDQHRPAGFHAIYLPFADDLLRPAVQSKVCPASQEQVEAAKRLLSCFDMDVDTAVAWENPALQQHYAVLEAMALNMEPRPVSALAPPDLGGNEAALQAFKSLVYGDDYDPTTWTGKKTASKKRSAAEMDGSLAEIDWAEHARLGTLKKLKVDQLKGYCSAKGLKVSGKKDDLIERISEHVAKP